MKRMEGEEKIVSDGRERLKNEHREDGEIKANGWRENTITRDREERWRRKMLRQEERGREWREKGKYLEMEGKE